MGRTISIGRQDFRELRLNSCFYADKTDFIRQWWESQDEVTLVTRPRRFGKTLNLSTVRYFFSPGYKEELLFDGLEIRKWDRYDELRGNIPVIFISFASVKGSNLEESMDMIKMSLADMYWEFRSMMEADCFSDSDREAFEAVRLGMPNAVAFASIKNLCKFVWTYYGVKPIVLIDEYDTPMQKAWTAQYWDEIVSFFYNLFTATFKDNQYLNRGLVTGITRVAKESLWSGLNNLNVVKTTSRQYETCFGFTQEEVDSMLREYELEDKREKVRTWYDGYKFGKVTGIYNPWSMTKFFKDQGEHFEAYWANTSGNELVGTLIAQGSGSLKGNMELLLQGKTIRTQLKEEVVYSDLGGSDEAIWGLLFASGYVTYDSIEYVNEDEEDQEVWFKLRTVNAETRLIFSQMVKGWFQKPGGMYNAFIKALLADDLPLMNTYLETVVEQTFSTFDTAYNQSESFYHAFVLGLIVEMQRDFSVKSNRESGFGRYDVCIIPKDINAGLCAYVLEFKLCDERNDHGDLEAAVARALEQIDEKGYVAEIVQAGIPEDHIRRYGLAFKGKETLIGR